MTSTTLKPAAQKWATIGTARMLGLGVRIDCDDGRTYAVAAEDLARFIWDGEPATVYRVDFDGRQAPCEAGHLDLSQSGRMVMAQIDGMPYTGMQMPAADFCRHYTRQDKTAVPVVAPPAPSWAVA